MRRRARYETTFDALDRMRDELRELSRRHGGDAVAIEAHRFAQIIDGAESELRAAIRAGALEEAALYATVERSWANIEAELGEAAAASLDISGLSAREVEVLRGLAEGQANKQIALRLGISSRTVRNHVSSIYTKLGVSARAEAAVHAVRMRLL